MTRKSHVLAVLVIGTSWIAAVAQQGATRPVITPRPDAEPTVPSTPPGVPLVPPVQAPSTMPPPATGPTTLTPATGGVSEPLPGSAAGASATSDAAPAPAGTQSTVGPAHVDASTYKLGLEDGISVTVWKEPSFSGNLMVRTDGMISLPLLGDVPAAGLTPMALSNDIAARLKKYINDPLVTVTVLAVNSKHLYMLGEVVHIGAMAYSPDVTPLQAISAAGGLTPYASASHIYILRTEGGKQRKIPFDYKKALKTGNQQGVSLQPGDTIVVP